MQPAGYIPDGIMHNIQWSVWGQDWLNNKTVSDLCLLNMTKRILAFRKTDYNTANHITYGTLSRPDVHNKNV